MYMSMSMYVQQITVQYVSGMTLANPADIASPIQQQERLFGSPLFECLRAQMIP